MLTELMRQHTEHQQRRLRMASRAYVEPSKVEVVPEIRLVHERAEDAGPPERSPTAVEPASEIRLVHDNPNPEPSPAEPVLALVQRPVPWLSEINEVVRKFYGVSEMDFNSERRQARLVFVRHVAMYLAKELTTRSYPAIGKQMGGRDHTTIINGVRKIQGLLLTDPRLNDELDLLVIKINEYAATRLARVQSPPFAGEA